MTTVSEALSYSESGAITVMSSGLDVDHTDFQLAMLKMKSIFIANRPMRERVRESLTQGVPWTDKERLATVITALGTAIAFEVAAFAMAGKLAAFGAAVATGLGLTASAGPLIICAIVAICAYVIFHAIGEIGGVISGVMDWIRTA